MNLNFSQIEIYCLTVPWQVERQKQISRMFLKNHGRTFEFIQGEKTTPYSKGLAKCHIEALKRSGDSPCLILEDDVVWNDKFPKEMLTTGSVELPDWADALYFGTSVFGRFRGSTIYRGLVSTEWNGALIRVFNKLSMHAVCHISKQYKEACIKVFEKYIENPIGGCDDPIADNMKYFNVFSLREGMFFQSDGHNDGATKEEIRTIL